MIFKNHKFNSFFNVDLVNNSFLFKQYNFNLISSSLIRNVKIFYPYVKKEIKEKPLFFYYGWLPEKKIYFFKKKKRRTFKSYLKSMMILRKLKLNIFFGILKDNQWKKLAKSSLSRRGFVLKNFILNLESRVDLILYRLGFITTIFEARNLINKGLILVNSKIIKRKSYRLSQTAILHFNNNNYFKKIILYNYFNKNLLNILPPNFIDYNYKLFFFSLNTIFFKLNSVLNSINLTKKDINFFLHYYYY